MATREMMTRRHVTEAARAAALEARRRKREAAVPRQTPEMFVVRLPGLTQQFGWEIRRFGAIVIDRSGTAYPTMLAARAGGAEALARRGVAA